MIGFCDSKVLSRVEGAEHRDLLQAFLIDKRLYRKPWRPSRNWPDIVSHTTSLEVSYWCYCGASHITPSHLLCSTSRYHSITAYHCQASMILFQRFMDTETLPRAKKTQLSDAAVVNTTAVVFYWDYTFMRPLRCGPIISNHYMVHARRGRSWGSFPASLLPQSELAVEFLAWGNRLR